MKKNNKISLELRRRFPLQKIFAQLLTVLILGQMVIPTFASNIKNFTTSPSLVEEICDVAVVRHSPGLNSGRAEGHVRVLMGEGIYLNSGITVTGDLLLPGTPSITINGTPTYYGTQEGTGSTSPSNYPVHINTGASLRHIVTRTDPITINNITPPPQPNGNRYLALNVGEYPGDFATIRDLTLNSNYGSLSVPPGTYGNFIANDNTSFVFGVIGENTTYNIQGLALNSNTRIQVLGNVTINLNTVFNLNTPCTIGDSTNPLALTLNIANGGLNLNGNTSIYGLVSLPQGTANVNSGGLIQGLLVCDRLNLNGGTLKGSCNSNAPTNQAPTVVGDNRIIKFSKNQPSYTVALTATAYDDGLPNELTYSWTKVSGPGTVTFDDPTNLNPIAAFSSTGVYILRITVSDGVLSASDDVEITITVFSGDIGN